MTTDSSWQPDASLQIIKQRASLLRKIRDFMDTREIIEVDTPQLSHYGISDPYIQSLTTTRTVEKDTLLYLQTSPEFCMKRLLAAGSGSIYQIAHVFRDEESGPCHSTEFTMLEWYRVGFDYYRLMDEVDALLAHIGLQTSAKMTYAEAFMQTVHIDPHSVVTKALAALCRQWGWDTAVDDRHAMLDFIFSTVVIKNINTATPLIIYDYPACMAALATLKQAESIIVSERFELFINGMEIANGFNELTDAAEQRKRFEADLMARRDKQLREVPIDRKLLAALHSGLPECAGIAVGIERLLMVLSGKEDISEVSTYTLANN